MSIVCGLETFIFDLYIDLTLCPQVLCDMRNFCANFVTFRPFRSSVTGSHTHGTYRIQRVTGHLEGRLHSEVLYNLVQ